MAQTARDQRLRKSRDFVAARRHGKRWSSGLLMLLARPNGLAATRVGLSVGRRVGNSVVRNRVKRRLREAARLADLPTGWDLVLVARGDAATADYDSLNRSVADLLRRARVVDGSKAAGAGKRKVE